MTWKATALAFADAVSGGAVSLTAGLPPGTVAAGATTAALAGAATDSGDSAAQPARVGTPSPSASGRPSASGAQLECCPRYQITGDYLLETNTGRVWKYDQGQKAFVAIPKKLLELDYWRTKWQFDDVVEMLEHEFDKEVLAHAPSALKPELKKKFTNDYVKIIQKELEKAKPGS